MGCNDLLTSQINANCPKTVKGFERVGYWALYDDLTKSAITITDNKVTMSTLNFGCFSPIYDESVKPFDGTKIVAEASSKHGYKLFNETVAFPLKAQNPDNASLVEALAKGKRIVVMLQQREAGTNSEGKYPIYGLSGGLYLSTPLADFSSDAAWELTFEDKNTDNAGLFVYDTDAATTETLVYNLTQYERITGLTIGNGETEHIDFESTKTGYLIQPDNTIISSVAGVIDATYSGVGGGVVLIIPKDAAYLDIQGSDFAGRLRTNLLGNINAESCPNLQSVYANLSIGSVSIIGSGSVTTLYAPYSNYIAASDCPNLSAQSIYDSIDNAYTLYLAGQSTGTLDFSGTTTAIDFNHVLNNGLTVTATLEPMADWTFDFNTI